MPDSNLADNSVLTSSFYNTYIREQVIVTCTSATRPTGVEGRFIYETDTDRLMRFDGSFWEVWMEPEQSWTPTLSATGTNPTLGTGSGQAGYSIRHGRLLTVWARIQFGTSGVNKGSGVYIVNLTTAASSLFSSTTSGNGSNIGIGHVYDSSALSNNTTVSVQLRTQNSVQFVVGAGGTLSDVNPFTFAAGDAITFSATYPIA